MKLHDLVQVSADVATTSSRLNKIAKLAELFTRIPPDDMPIAIGFLTGWPRQGRIGVGWATVAAAREREPAPAAALDLREVDKIFARLLSVRGKNSASERTRLIGDLFARATVDEQNFLGALLIGEVRQGALEGVMLEAIAKAAGVPGEQRASRRHDGRRSRRCRACSTGRG